MIPVSLWLKNFLSYGDDLPLLDFTAFRVACLTGKNGHGKSALLDAITWALWGEARKSGYNRTPDAGLLRLNATEMAVEFTFLLEDQEYQVYRDYVLTKRGSGRLEFRVRRPGESEHTLLSGGGKKETQARIIETLGLDYPTFVNSSFLRQGHADEFTRQVPSERKKILGSILALDRYDRLLDETKFRLQAAKSELKILEDSTSAIDRELEEEPDLQEQLETLQTQISTLEKEGRKEKEVAALLRDKLSGLKTVTVRLQDIARQETEIQDRQRDLSARQKKAQSELDRAQAILSREDEITQNKLRFDQITQELETLLQVEADYRALESQRLALQAVLDQEAATLRERRAALASEKTQIQQALNESQAIAERKTEIEDNYKRYQETCARLAATESLRPQYEEILAQQTEWREKIEAVKNQITQAVAEYKGRTQRIPALLYEKESLVQALQKQPTLEEQNAKEKERLDTIEAQGVECKREIDLSTQQLEQIENAIAAATKKQALIQNGDTQACPLCNSPLGPDGIQHLVSSLDDEIQRHQQTKINLQQKLEKANTDLLWFRGEYTRLRTSSQQRGVELTQLALKTARLAELESELQTLLGEKSHLQELQRKIETRQYAFEEHIQLAACAEALQQLGYSPETHATLQKHWQTQQAFLQAWQHLQEASTQAQRHQARLAIVQTQWAEIDRILATLAFSMVERKQIEDLQAKILPLQKKLERRATLQTQSTMLHNALMQWEQCNQARLHIPELREDLVRITTQITQLTERLLELTAQRHEEEPRLQELQPTEKQLAAKEKAISLLETQSKDLHSQAGALQSRLAHLRTRKQELQANRARGQDLARDIQHYDILRKAFSRDGIPAMIIDQVLPELETDANRLLHQLTNGACSVKLESQREKKSGGMSETLDIKISDEMGTRDYEMFSGGEAFRTDLALRIALSQLLCRRAGRKLQTLVIDEGFGTQDSEGLGHIVEAINDIQDEFEKILVVTHLDELKEKFLARIEVTKEPGIGSRFDVFYTG